MDELLLRKVEDIHEEIRAINQSSKTIQEETTRKLDLHEATIRKIEAQLGQLTQDLQSIAPPIELVQCWAVTSRSGMHLEKQIEEEHLENKKKIQMRISREIEIIFEDPKFMNMIFNVTNYANFVKKSIANKKNLKEKKKI